MKKLIVSLFILITLTGCVRIENASIDDIVRTTIKGKYHLYNHVNRGYKYYLPRELEVTKSYVRNEVIKSKYYDYYLYVDLVQYNNKTKENLEENTSYYYSKTFEYQDKSGILNIQALENNQYLIYASYYYARIEVVVEEKDINTSVANAMVIISSVEYNDEVIQNLLKEDKLNASEESVDVFDDDLRKEDFLEVGDTEDDSDDIYDLDVIK